MKQYRITTADFITPEDNDCVLAPDDPIHELMGVAQLGGIGGEAALSNYNAKLPSFNQDDRGKVQRENNIKPGTPAWFELWFGKGKIT